MGCAQSKVDNEEAVARCKERKILMKEAVGARNAFAAGHSGYAKALKDTGAALNDYAHGEAEHPSETVLQSHRHVIPPLPPQIIMETLPPPPPLPNFSPSPIKRASSMPEVKLKKMAGAKGLDSSAIDEGQEDEDEEDEQEKLGRKKNKDEKNTPWDFFYLPDNIPGPSMDPDHEIEGEATPNAEEEPRTPDRVSEEKIIEKEAEAKTVDNGQEKPFQPSHQLTEQPQFMAINPNPGTVSLMQVLAGIDDHFLKASDSAAEVSKMLEATRLPYHSNFADNRGHIDHSARVMRVITWNKSFKEVGDPEVGKEEIDFEEFETHATVLDKLLAWEKKLYDEVKQGEVMKLEYKKKVALLNKQKKRGASVESMEKTKAAVSNLHTRYIVDMQSLDSTVSEVSHIRDKQLYPRLISLVDALAIMWGDVSLNHEAQLKIMTDLKGLEIANDVKETSRHHHEQTKQLHKVILGWQAQFEKLSTQQRQYIRCLNKWLKLNLIPIESSLKEKVTSPPRPQTPPIQNLLVSWNDFLEKLPDEVAKSAITSFAAVIKAIIDHQEEEMKLKERCEETRREYVKKNQALEDWNQKYLQKRNGEGGEDANARDPLADRLSAVEGLKGRWEEEMDAHQRHCLQVREKSLGSLKIRLPEVFRALSEYSRSCCDIYEKLRLIVHSPQPDIPGS